MSLGISNGVLNQKNAPAIYEDIFANRPAAGFSGRIFISTDTSQIFVDNGTSWVLIANTGIGSTGNLQVVTTNGNTTSAGIVITAGGLTTNAITQASLTSGSVIFATTGGQLSQDNSNLFWDNTNKWLGIGVAPSSPLDIHSSASASMLALNNTGGNASNIIFLNASVNKWRIGNTNSNTFDLFNNQIGTTALSFSGSNSAATFINSITATSLIKSGGTSSQFLKADGSVDSSSYITLTSLSGTTPLQYNSSTGAFSILQAGASQSGYLSSTDWNTFNSKASLTAFSATTPLSYNSGTGAFSIQVANTGQSGYLTNTDWNTFNNKQSALSLGNLTETSSSVLTIAGGTGAVIGSGTTIAVKQSSAIQSGYLSSTDWNTFNNKQAALSNPITGTGVTNYVPKFNGTTSLTSSLLFDSGTYIGIGTTTPAASLDVNGSLTYIANFNNTTQDTRVSFSNAGTQNLQISTSNSQINLYGVTNIPLLIYTNSTERMRISNAGNVGINTTSPAAKLHVKSVSEILRLETTSATGQNYLTFANASGEMGYIGYGSGVTNNFFIQNEQNTDTLFFTNSTERMRITNVGNVGINTSTPYSGANAAKLQVRPTTDINLAIQYGTYDSTSVKLNAFNDAATVNIPMEINGSILYFKTGESLKGQFDASGNLLLNGATSSNGQGKLQNTSQSFTGGLGIGGLTFSTNTTATVNTSFYFFNGGAGVTLTLPDTNGQSMVYYIKNYSASPLTIARSGSNTFIAAGTITTVTSLTLATGVSTTLIGNGTTNYIQIQ